MKYRLSDHVRQEIERRRIPLRLLEEVLEVPEQIVPEKAGRKSYQARRDIGGKMFLMRAIVGDTVEPAVVVKVYRTTKVQKYWRTP